MSRAGSKQPKSSNALKALKEKRELDMMDQLLNRALNKGKQMPKSTHQKPRPVGPAAPWAQAICKLGNHNHSASQPHYMSHTMA